MNRIGMNASHRIQLVVAAGILLLFSGCAAAPETGMLGGFRMPGGKVPPARAIPTPSMPGSGAVPAMPGAAMSSALVPDPNKSIQQAGFQDVSAGGCTNGCCSTASQIPSSQHPAAHPVTTAGCETGSCPTGSCPTGSCPTGSCPTGSCWPGCNSGACPPVTPFGYAMPPANAWNVYGADPQEFVCDGGDHDPAAKLRRDGVMAGLQSEDTVAHYTTDSGDVHVQPSTRACIYSPRFASVRKVSSAASGGRVIGLSGIAKPIGPNRFEHQVPGLVINDTTELGHADVTRRPDAMRDRNRGVRIGNVIQPLVTDEIMVALATLQRQGMGQLRDTDLALIERFANAAVAWTVDASVEVAIEDLKAPTLTRDRKVDSLTTYEFPDAGRLQIIKLADRAHAQPGETVSFVIHVQNVGDSAVNHVVLTDNLTTRLQYVEDSQSCTVDADFETAMNEGQSLRLEWTLKEELGVGEVAEIRFECLLR
tara:strand:+ start:27612 stop:29051 length:1440 start_codon:yes stop_codon:yes gene_type:complete